MCDCSTMVVGSGLVNSSFCRIGDAVSTGGNGGSFNHRSAYLQNNDETTDVVVCHEDGTVKTLSVTEGLRTCDLCELLAVKNHVTRDPSWCLVERWNDPAIERIVEDHEDVLTVFRSMKMMDEHAVFRFRQFLPKYDFFFDPQEFFLDEMTELPSGKAPSSGCRVEKFTALQNMLTISSGTPDVFSWLWISDLKSGMWKKSYFWLRGRSLYCCNNPYQQGTPVRDVSRFSLFSLLEDCTVYTCSDARRQFSAPCDQAVVLFTPRQPLRCLSCEDPSSQLCWITALRLAKYGRLLYDNFLYQKLQEDGCAGGAVAALAREREYSCSMPDSCGHRTAAVRGTDAVHGFSTSPSAVEVGAEVLSAGVRSMVAMDFTGGTGRVVTDPVEAKAIELAEGHHSRRIERRISVLSAVPCTSCTDPSLYNNQPWFHEGISRDESCRLLSKHLSRDGLFLVRQSHTKPSAFVLTFVHDVQLYHCQVLAMTCSEPNSESPITYLSLDCGRTRFYDLLQLVEFYQLNAGVLPTRLTHFITHGHADAIAATRSATHARSC